jgi:hypothetical protein
MQWAGDTVLHGRSRGHALATPFLEEDVTFEHLVPMVQGRLFGLLEQAFNVCYDPVLL